MTISQIEAIPLATTVELTEDELIVSLSDGRKISVPLAWFPRLLNATKDERAEFRFLGGGEGIHWPRIDEDISVAALLRGKATYNPRPVDLSVEYRRPENGDCWHWCERCSCYPASNYFARRSRPAAGELCNECAAKTRKSVC